MIWRTIFLVLGTVTLLYSVAVVFDLRHLDDPPITVLCLPLAGIGFMIAALAVGLTESRRQQQPPAGTPLRDDHHRGTPHP
ncbi:hypothetical protein ACWDTT_21120 [Streptosporangium sandarakinum]|uniref:hypothetical protein n=1 Tax=Streptosporangium TaxID=2000 RepID=UPI0031F95AE3